MSHVRFYYPSVSLLWVDMMQTGKFGKQLFCNTEPWADIWIPVRAPEEGETDILLFQNFISAQSKWIVAGVKFQPERLKLCGLKIYEMLTLEETLFREQLSRTGKEEVQSVKTITPFYTFCFLSQFYQQKTEDSKSDINREIYFSVYLELQRVKHALFWCWTLKWCWIQWHFDSLVVFRVGSSTEKSSCKQTSWLVNK